MNIQKNVVLAPFTTFGIGGPADYFCTVHSQEELLEAVQWASVPTSEVKRTNTSEVSAIPFFILGSGANILIGDKGFRGLVIKNESQKFTIADAQVTADSGVTMEELIKITAAKGLSGLEHFAGIPSTLGGALWQNLHFLSADRKETVFIGDLITESRIMNQELRIMNVKRDYFKFSYDYSILHDNKDIVLSATLQLTLEDPKIIKQRIDANITWRKEKHPEYGWRVSAGSVFKKIKGAGAGRLIEKVGLKGYKIGGAQISLKHANFIINTGGATAADVRALIDLVQKKVKKELGYDMKTEISFVGEF